MHDLLQGVVSGSIMGAFWQGKSALAMVQAKEPMQSGRLPLTPAWAS